MARALLVGCGCRARELGARLIEAGWLVRGTTRDPARVAEIERAGIEAVVADPDRVATVLDHVGDVTTVAWLLGSARGSAGEVEALHGPRLERLCEELVDTPVRGIVYEGAGSAPRAALEHGRQVLREASDRWRIPVEVIEGPSDDHAAWTAAAAEAAQRLTRR